MTISAVHKPRRHEGNHEKAAQEDERCNQIHAGAGALGQILDPADRERADEARKVADRIDEGKSGRSTPNSAGGSTQAQVQTASCKWILSRAEAWPVLCSGLASNYPNETK